jgi:hypothetical protein
MSRRCPSVGATQRASQTRVNALVVVALFAVPSWASKGDHKGRPYATVMADDRHDCCSSYG